MDNPNQENSEVSKFNEANLQIMRLHEYWQLAESRATAGNLYGWRWVLDSIWRELYPDVLRMKNSKELIRENSKWVKFCLHVKSSGQLYAILDKRHQFLKKIQDDAGKGGSYESSTEADFD